LFLFEAHRRRQAEINQATPTPLPLKVFKKRDFSLFFLRRGLTLYKKFIILKYYGRMLPVKI
jgi:hypothetical protein